MMPEGREPPKPETNYRDMLMGIKQEKEQVEVDPEEQGEIEDEKDDEEIVIEDKETEAEKQKYNEKRKELELRVKEIVDVNRLQVTRNELVLNNVDWFNVCCGITEYDLLFEERCRNVIDTMGITIKRSDIMKTLNTIVGNEKYKTALKRAIKGRLLKCAEIHKHLWIEY